VSGMQISARRPRLDPGALVDALARCGVVLWFGTVAYTFAPGIAKSYKALAFDDPLAVMALISSVCLFCFYLLIVWLTLIRTRPIAKLPGLRARLEAALGAFLVYALPFLPRTELGTAGHILSTVLMGGGTGLALVVLSRLGRSFSIMPEARGLVTGGPYRIVRHPLYLAEAVAMIGAAMQFAWLPAVALVAAQWLFQIRRIFNEEAVLRQTFPDYPAYMRRTARLIPFLW
jgi:protein-S-isoprenylcysteine O-methyltransferase Ste14